MFVLSHRRVYVFVQVFLQVVEKRPRGHRLEPACPSLRFFPIGHRRVYVFVQVFLQVVETRPTECPSLRLSHRGLVRLARVSKFMFSFSLLIRVLYLLFRFC